MELNTSPSFLAVLWANTNVPCHQHIHLGHFILSYWYQLAKALNVSIKDFSTRRLPVHNWESSASECSWLCPIAASSYTFSFNLQDLCVALWAPFKVTFVLAFLFPAFEDLVFFLRSVWFLSLLCAWSLCCSSFTVSSGPSFFPFSLKLSLSLQGVLLFLVRVAALCGMEIQRASSSSKILNSSSGSEGLSSFTVDRDFLELKNKNLMGHLLIPTNWGILILTHHEGLGCEASLSFFR